MENIKYNENKEPKGLQRKAIDLCELIDRELSVFTSVDKKDLIFLLLLPIGSRPQTNQR